MRPEQVAGVQGFEHKLCRRNWNIHWKAQGGKGLTDPREKSREPGKCCSGNLEQEAKQADEALSDD